MLNNGPGEGRSNSLGIHGAHDLGFEAFDVLADFLKIGSILSEASCGLKERKPKGKRASLKPHLSNWPDRHQVILYRVPGRAGQLQR